MTVAMTIPRSHARQVEPLEIGGELPHHVLVAHAEVALELPIDPQVSPAGILEVELRRSVIEDRHSLT